MKDYIYQVLQDVGTLTVGDILVRLVMGFVIGLFIMLSYKISHSGTIYSQKFNVSLFILTILSTMVMTVIGNNVALSLGMVGALSIVRFRTAVKDTRDTVYIFWAIIVGICCGVGDYVVASIGSFVVFLALLFVGSIKNDNRMLLVVRSNKVNELKIESIVFTHYNGKANLKVKNTTPEKVEFIYELSKKDYTNTQKKENSITDKLYCLVGTDYVNLITQSDELGS